MTDRDAGRNDKTTTDGVHFRVPPSFVVKTMLAACTGDAVGWSASAWKDAVVEYMANRHTLPRTTSKRRDVVLTPSAPRAPNRVVLPLQYRRRIDGGVALVETNKDTLHRIRVPPEFKGETISDVDYEIDVRDVFDELQDSEAQASHGDAVWARVRGTLDLVAFVDVTLGCAIKGMMLNVTHPCFGETVLAYKGGVIDAEEVYFFDRHIDDDKSKATVRTYLVFRVLVPSGVKDVVNNTFTASGQDIVRMMWDPVLDTIRHHEDACVIDLQFIQPADERVKSDICRIFLSL